MKKFIVEFIGTFFLVFIIGCASVSGSVNVPLVIGSGLMCLVFAGGHISGAHYNPAVTTAVIIRGKIGYAEAASYMLWQLAGGFLGAIASYYMTGNPEAVGMGPGSNISALQAVIAEFAGTFVLAYVVLNAATGRKYEGNSFFGLAIGFTVFVMASCLGGISGGAFNPAVGIARTLADTLLNKGNTLTNAWIYIVGPLTGGIAAAFVFNYVHED